MKLLVIFLGGIISFASCQFGSTPSPFGRSPFTFSSFFNRPSTTSRPYFGINRYRFNSDDRYSNSINGGRYNPNNDGRYNPNNDGRYRGDNSGRYDDNSGRYVPDDAGRYEHSDNKYQHQDGAGGQYEHQDGGIEKYVGSKDSYSGDKYRGDNNPYIGDNDKYGGDKYRGDNNPYRGDGKSGQYQGNKDSQIGGKNGENQPLGPGGSKLIGSGSQGTGIFTGLPSISSDDGRIGNGNRGYATGLSGTQGSDKCNWDSPKNFKIIREKSDLGGPESYHYLFETENCMYKEEKGVISNKDTKDEILRAKGYYHYVGPDKVKYVVTYSSDENGFIPEGAHIPTVPPLILKGLKYLKSIGKL